MTTSHTIALVGKPNCGKTALFNQLTGSRQKVANYPGVTVERKEGCLNLANKKYTVIDLPGAYTLNARSPDELITREVILGRLTEVPKPELLVCVADATSLRFCLRLLLELKQLNRPVVLALNMSDLAQKQGIAINVDLLSQLLGVPVVSTVAVKKQGIDSLLNYLNHWQPSTSVGIAKEWSLPTVEDLHAWHAQVDDIIVRVSTQIKPAFDLTYHLDRWLLHPVVGLMGLMGLMFLVFQAVFGLAEIPMNLIDGAMSGLHNWVSQGMSDGPLKSLLADGIIAGVGSVVIFLPQILILFFFILLLEDTGYMARAAFLLDRLMGTVGLHGKAFIPLLSSFACAIPGIMATRTIDNRRDRLATIMIAPLMTCSARIPVYTLIIAAFVPARTVWGGIQLQGLVMFGLYILGIVSALLIAWVMKRFTTEKTQAPFLMELPSYKQPNLKNLFLGLVERAKIFLKRAGTIIFMLMVLVWFLSTFPGAPAGATEPAIYYSFAGQLGRMIAPIFEPIGFNWQMTVALIPGMAAREVAVAALGTVYALSDVSDAAIHSLTSLLAQQWSLASALAFLAWYVFAPQCVATLGVVKRETNSWRWPIIMFIYLIALAYGAAWLTFHITHWLTG